MENILILFLCLLAGFLLRQSGKITEASGRTFNIYVLYVCLPAMVLKTLHHLEWNPELLLPIFMPWIHFILVALFIPILGKKAGWSRETIGCLILTVGLGNTSFVGFPMIEALLGKDHLPVAVLIDQGGSFLVVATLGILVATRYGSGTTSASAIVKKIIFFPSVIATVVAILLQNYEYPAWFLATLTRLADTLAPVALFAVGSQITFKDTSSIGPLSFGIVTKLLVIPALFYLFFQYFLDSKGMIFQTTIFEAAMPTMVTGGILAIDHKLNPHLAALMLGMSILISFGTLWFWKMILV